MPRIKMLKTEMGADCHSDGRSHGCKPYVEGEEYEVGERLAVDFCDRMKVAKRMDEKKFLKGAPENKAA